MNREIKFRAWDNVDMKMYYLGEEDNIHFYFDSAGIIAERFYNEEVCTPEGDRGFYGNSENLEHLKYLEYTGLKDKIGVEIFEGDILRREGYWDIYIAHDVANAGFGFLNADWVVSQGKTKPIDKYMMNDYEVIGNIYENPELLIK